MTTELWAIPFSVPLAPPLWVGRAALAVREGVVVAALDVDRVVGLGEAAPLPGVSRDGLADVWQSLRQSDTLSTLEVSPAAALARWSAADPASCAPAPVVATARLCRTVNEVPAEGDGTWKIKVGTLPLLDEARALSSLAARGARLRLDGNRGLTVDDARLLGEAAGAALEIFEEPTPLETLAALPRWLPLALDESLNEGAGGDDVTAVEALLDALPATRCLVLKPTVLGPARERALSALAARRGLAVTVSSAYETPIGIACLRRRAAALAPDHVHGLDARVRAPFLPPRARADVVRLGGVRVR
jgi:O-succinylbenzoate synthase